MAVVRNSAGVRDMIDPTLTASFAAISLTDLAPLTQQTWDPLLARDPRLLVPVDVRAIVVDDGETCEHALAGSSLLGATAPEHRTPPPFSDADPRKAGVYLHWALPDGLTHGRADGDASVGLRPLPDRWFIARIEAASHDMCARGSWRPSTVAAHPSERWPGGAPVSPARTPTMASADLHAAAGGDPAWAALWDSVKTDSQSTTTSPTNRDCTFSSLVAGWYSIPTSTCCNWHRPTPRSTT